MLNFTLFETGTPERLLAGIVAGLTIGIDGEDCACSMGGFGTYAGIFRDCGCGNGGSGERVEGVGDNETGELPFWINPLII
ncbi:MAG: hypothetical protein STSR0009_27360 [Methanoregula sp.]